MNISLRRWKQTSAPASSYTLLSVNNSLWLPSQWAQQVNLEAEKPVAGPHTDLAIRVGPRLAAWPRRSHSRLGCTLESHEEET